MIPRMRRRRGKRETRVVFSKKASSTDITYQKTYDKSAPGSGRSSPCPVCFCFSNGFSKKSPGAGIKSLPKGNAAARQDAISFEEPRFSLLLPRTHISFGEPHLSNNPSFADQCVFRVGSGEARKGCVSPACFCLETALLFVRRQQVGPGTARSESQPPQRNPRVSPHVAAVAGGQETGIAVLGHLERLAAQAA